MNLFNIKKQPDGNPGKLPAGLQTEADRFKVIIESIDDGVVLIDGEQAIQMLNPGAAAICGWKADDATGLDFSNIIHLVDNKGQEISDADNPIEQVFQSGQNARGDDAILLNHDKQQIPITLRVTPLFDDQKNVTAVVAVFSNVSQQRAEEKQRVDFISTASHEMRTPVAAIEGYLALALNEKVSTIDNRARGYLEKAHSSTEHLGKLFQDLLTSAKAEDGRLTSHPAVLEMGEFLEQLAGDLRLIAEKKGLFMEYMVGNSQDSIDASGSQGGGKVIRPLYYVNVDSDRLREVLTNLFDNATKYTPDGKITIGLTGNDSVVQ